MSDYVALAIAGCIPVHLLELADKLPQDNGGRQEFIATDDQNPRFGDWQAGFTWSQDNVRL